MVVTTSGITSVAEEPCWSNSPSRSYDEPGGEVL
jgi:hypothetical protein